MLRLPNIEEFQRRLLQVPHLMNRYAARDQAFLTAVTAWFSDVERLLLANRLAIAAEVASLRGSIISAQRGDQKCSGVPLRQAARRRMIEATAAASLKSAVEVITRRIDQDMVLIDSAEKAAQQLVILARQLNLIAADLVTTDSYSSLRPLWNLLADNEQTAKHTIYIRSLVGPSDALILLDKVLAQWQAPVA